MDQEEFDGLRRDVTLVKQGMGAEYDRMYFEVETQKKLSRYARRTWFEMMAWMLFGGILMSDVARAYATSQWWDLVYWVSPHGHGGTLEWILRSVGLTWQAIILVILNRRSQVPEWIADRIPYAEEQRLHKRKRMAKARAKED